METVIKIIKKYFKPLNTCNMKISFILFILTASFTACNTPGSKSQSAEINKYDSLLNSVDTYLQSYVDSGFAGVALIADKDGIIFHKAYNGKGDNIDTSTAFLIASNTKGLTGLAIVRLHEQGKLSVNDSITKYFDNVPADKRNITIQQLLTHTSGFDNCNCTDGEMDKQKIINGILHTALQNPVGAKWSYANENYNLLAYIIEKVSGISFRDYITKNILDVAGMNHTDEWGYEKELSVTIAPIMLDSFKKQPLYNKIFSNDVYKTGLAIHGSGGYFSTTGDIYKLTQAIRANKIISDSSFRMSLQPNTSGLIRNKDTALYYGYGMIYTMTKGKRINVFNAGREDWMMNSRIYMMENGFTIVVWTRDKSGPNYDAIATLLTNELVKMSEKIN